MNDTVKKTLDALKKNRFDTYYAENSEEARRIALSLIPEGASIAVGGSATLTQLGLLNDFRSGRYSFIDRYSFNDEAERAQKLRDGLEADFFFMSTNAVTEDGVLYNVDGRGNRVAALDHGPLNVIVIAGRNKIVSSLAEAVLRVKTVAAPLNAKRLGYSTYCAAKGRCVSVDQGCAECMTAGCASPERICSKYSVQSMQFVPSRIKVILVDEELGY